MKGAHKKTFEEKAKINALGAEFDELLGDDDE